MITPYTRARRSPIKFAMSNSLIARWQKFRSGILYLLLLFYATDCLSQRLTPLSQPPDWSRLDRFQETITRSEFADLLNTVYAPNNAAGQWIKLDPANVVIQENANEKFTLRFAASPGATVLPPRYWKPAESFGADPERPLSGVSIAIDPGHLGGDWAKMEERWFQIGDSVPVKEGDLTLRVAQLLAPRLERLGAKVTLVRSAPGPVTGIRPNQLTAQAVESLRDRGVTSTLPSYNGPADPNREDSVPWEAERLFYRVDEIHTRARIVNEQIKPDLTVCLHFNAEPWGDPVHPVLVRVNHLHLLVNGAYRSAELGYDDERFAMLLKLLNRSYREELACSEAVAAAMARITGLPPYHYSTPNAQSVGTSGYVWARNLLANRLYECPVIYIEAYVMNSEDFFARVQAGEYDGIRNFGGVMRQNIFQEYVEGVVQGLSDYFRAARRGR
jgi:hypothetical protein